MSRPSARSPVEFFTGKSGYLKRWWTPPPPVFAVRVSGSLPCLASREASASAPPLRGSTSSAKKPASLTVATPIFAFIQVSHRRRIFTSSVEVSRTPFFCANVCQRYHNQTDGTAICPCPFALAQISDPFSNSTVVDAVSPNLSQFAETVCQWRQHGSR